MQKNNFAFQLLQDSLIIDKLYAMLSFYTFENAKKMVFYCFQGYRKGALG